MFQRLRQDSLITGMILGLVLPLILFIILWAIIVFIGKTIGVHHLVSLDKLILLSLVINLITMRYYLLKLKYDKTGRGILVVTFILGIAFFLAEMYVFGVL